MTAEDLLTRTLTEVTETAEYPTTPMSTVVSRSRTIRGRRRRRTASVAAAAVVVAGGLSAALMLGHGGDATPAPAGPLGGFPEGSPPTIDYLDGDAFVTSSGQRVTSPTFARAATAVQWGKGVLAASRPTSRDPLSTISFVSGGLVSRVGCGTPSFVVPADGGDPVYWLSHECKPDRAAGRFVQGYTSRDTTKGATFTPVGEVDDGSIVSSVSASQLRLTSRVVVAFPGSDLTPLPLLVPSGVSEAASLVSGLALNAQDSVVVDAVKGAVLWRAPSSWNLGRFSPSGRYVAGIQSVGPQQQVSSVGDVVGLWDARTGHQVVRTVLPGLLVDGQAWESDDSLLVVAEDRNGQEAILRVGVDGTVTRTTPAVSGVPRPAVGRPPVATLRFAATP